MKKSITEYFQIESNNNKLEWKELFSLADLNNQYVAQGIITYGENIFLHTIHKKNKKSVIIIFEKKEKFEYIKKINLPKEATHTSDLTIYEGHLYAIDYHSNFIYKFDIDELVNNHKLILLKRIYTGIKKSGSLEIIKNKEKSYLLVTSFLDDENMYIFDFDKMVENNITPDKHLLFTIKNSYFVQGLYYCNERKTLFQSMNRFGLDIIYEINFDKLITLKNLKGAIIKSFIAPEKMIEDLVVKGDYVYTSDEYSNKIYFADLKTAQLVKSKNEYNLENIQYYDKLLSHRARVGFFQENTLDAFLEVLKTNIKYIEMDIRFSKDDECYLYHDSYFKDGKEHFRISDHNKEYINNVKYSNVKTEITKLSDLLNTFKKNKKEGQFLAIDIKDYGYEQRIFDLFKKYEILDSVIIFTWTPQTIFAFDEIFSKENKSFPLYLSHVRTDSIFKYLLVPYFLNYKKLFLTVKDFVLIGNSNYKENLGKLSKGYRHVPYFSKLPEDLKGILKKYNGGICVTKSLRENLLKKLHNEGLKIAIFGAVFGLSKIDTKDKFLKEASKYYIDIVFMDNIENIM